MPLVPHRGVDGDDDPVRGRAARLRQGAEVEERELRGSAHGRSAGRATSPSAP